VWSDGVAAATIMAIAISWWLAMRGGSPAEDLRIRRDVVLGMCYILFVAIVSWIGFLLDGPRVGATTAVACVIAGIGLVLARGPIGDAPERSTTLAQTGKESRLFGSDIAVLRFIERFVLTLLFWAPASVIYAAIENQPDAEEFSFQLLIIFLVYRAIKASQRKEIRVNSLIARLISVTSLGDQSQRTRLMTV
jgi:hypothetical protein